MQSSGNGAPAAFDGEIDEMAIDLTVLRRIGTLADGTVVRPASPPDLPALVALLTDDVLGSGREADFSRAENAYRAAFDAIDGDPRQALLVLAAPETVAVPDRLLGTMQLTMVPGLSQQGLWRGQIEAVRIAGDRRGSGLGASFLAEAEDRLARAGCGLAQLSTNRTRLDAHRFYERAGWTASHIGFKKPLPSAPDG